MREITILKIPVAAPPQVLQCEPTFEAFEKLLHQRAEVSCYLPGAVAVIIRHRKNAQELRYNRALWSEGNRVDIIVGDFLLVSDPNYDCNFQSLSEKDILNYYASFFCIEEFTIRDNEVCVSKYDPVSGTSWRYQ